MIVTALNVDKMLVVTADASEPLTNPLAQHSSAFSREVLGEISGGTLLHFLSVTVNILGLPFIERCDGGHASL